MRSWHTIGGRVITTRTPTSLEYFSHFGQSPAPPPPSGIPVGSYTELQNAVAANPAGTTFLLTNNMSFPGQLPLKAGNQYWGDPANPPIITGPGYNSGIPFATATVNNVTLAHLHAQQFGRHQATERGAMVGSAGFGGTGWLLKFVELSHTVNCIIDINPGWRMEDCVFHSAGRHWGTGGGGGTLKSWYRCEAYGIANGTGGIPIFPNHQGDIGCKFAFTTDVYMEDMYVHDMGGNGIWFDLANERVHLVRPRAERVQHAGIFFEVSYGPFTVDDPVVIECGLIQDPGAPYPYPAYAGILCSLTPDITINNMLVDGGPGNLTRHGAIVLHWPHPALNFGNINSTRLGNQNVIFNGGQVTRIRNPGRDVGLNGPAGARQSGDDGLTRPNCNIHWNNVTLDPNPEIVGPGLHIAAC